MERLKRLFTPGLAIAAGAALLGFAGTAVADHLITGDDVQNGSLTGEDVRTGSITSADISNGTIRGKDIDPRTLRALLGDPAQQAPLEQTPGQAGGQGAAGPQGERGERGPQGAPGPGFSSTRWGVIGRNTIGAPIAYFREGPWGRTAATFAADQSPPRGTGSLGIHVGSAADKTAFGNESDFANLKIDSITNLSYSIFIGEDSLAGHTPPNVQMEVDPDVDGPSGPINYTTLVYLPDGSAAPSRPAAPAANVWQSYDALDQGNLWYSTRDLNADPAVTLCQQSEPCSFTQLLDQLGPNAEVSFSLAIGKGRDNEFTGAVDALRVNDTVYDFESVGVVEVAP